MIDDSLFNVALNDNVECVELILRIILDKADLKVETVKTQYTIPNVLSHGVRFDALATSNGKIYDIEIQRDDSGAIPRRARYNSSMLDVNSLRAGAKYNELPETYVIFITENDPLKKNKPIYHIDRKIAETGEDFNDGTHIIYVNGANRDDTSLGRLMQDFFCTAPSKINYKVLADRIKYLKETEEGVHIMTSIEREIYDKGKEEGREEGREEVVLAMLKAKQSITFIAEIMNMPKEKIVEIGKINALISDSI